jgi:hypothetical protein
MVEYLNSLRTQQQNSNSSYIYEGRHDFLRSLREQAPWFPDEERLYVRTQLDTLVEDIAKGTSRIRLLLLTGDAGDGKTAFCAALARRLGLEEELKHETVIGSWRIIKDASAVDEGDLAKLVEAHIGGSPAEGLVVAINEGRLRRLFRGLARPSQELWKEVVEPALEGWLDHKGATALDEAMRRERVLVINFRHRFHVRPVTTSLLEAWTSLSLWEGSPACPACPARTRCPILANVKDLRSPIIQERIADVLAYYHFSGQRRSPKNCANLKTKRPSQFRTACWASCSHKNAARGRLGQDRPSLPPLWWKNRWRRLAGEPCLGARWPPRP